MTAFELIGKFVNWLSGVTKKKVENQEDGYTWTYKDIEYDKELKIKDYQDFFDRKELNKEYKENYNIKELDKRKPYLWHQAEINIVAGFHKGFAMRNQTRLQYYRHDLSQKGARTLSSINISLGRLAFAKDNANKK